MKISMSKQYQTRDGRSVKIIATDVEDMDGGDVVGLLEGSLFNWYSDGRLYEGESNSFDLIEVDEMVYANITEDGSFYTYSTLNSALRSRAVGDTTYQTPVPVRILKTLLKREAGEWI